MHFDIAVVELAHPVRFSALEIVIHFAFLIAMLASSILSEYIDPMWILVGAGFLCVFVGLFGMIKYKDGGGLATDKKLNTKF